MVNLFTKMPCHSPIVAYASSALNPTGKRSMVFTPNGSHTGIRQKLPCGKCAGCKLERSRVWGIRCLHESKMYAENCFITMTYRDECLPRNGSLVLSDYQKFMKRLRTTVDRFDGRKFRFFGCGEYGETHQRPHYHVLLFGLDFHDKKFYAKNKRDEDIFTSAVLDGIWKLGSCKIGAVTFDSCAYVARYCVKKIDGDQRDAGHYVVYDSDGVVSERLPEFCTMSRMPGLGTAYYEKYGHEIRAHDTLVVNGTEVPSIRYYDEKFEALDPAGFAVVKKRRVRRRMRLGFIERVSPDRRRVKEVLLLKRLAQAKRLL